MLKKLWTVFTLGTTALIAANAHGSCGAAFCMANSDWNIQGIATEAGLRADVRYEYVDQDQPRFRNEKVSVGAVRRHHDEIETTNRNLIASFDYSFDNGRGISVQIPYILSREHSHIHNHGGAQIFDSWDLSGLGDIRILARRQSPSDLSMSGVRYGLKFPTGDFEEQNESGDVAERSLQMGTGTTDLLLGTFYNRVSDGVFASWFTQAMLQAPLNERAGFRPGAQLTVDLGGRYEVSSSLNALLQINAQFKHADTGREAENKDSGGQFFFLSPGFSYSVTRDTRIYGFVQLPLYQRVHGVQITSDLAAVVGVNVGLGK